MSNLSNSVNALPPPNPVFVFHNLSPECAAVEKLCSANNSVVCTSDTAEFPSNVFPQYLFALTGALDITMRHFNLSASITFYFFTQSNTTVHSLKAVTLDCCYTPIQLRTTHSTHTNQCSSNVPQHNLCNSFKGRHQILLCRFCP